MRLWRLKIDGIADVIRYPEGLDAQLVAFTVTTDDVPATLRNISYCADMPECRDIRIEIVTTTYRKEQQVANNIDMIREELMEHEEWGKHFHLTVVDNGRTLPDSVRNGDSFVTIIPNGNVGGPVALLLECSMRQNRVGRRMFS